MEQIQCVCVCVCVFACARMHSDIFNLKKGPVYLHSNLNYICTIKKQEIIEFKILIIINLFYFTM
jgi:hypothetical protein